MEVSRRAGELLLLEETRDNRHQAGLAALRGRIPGLGRIARNKGRTSSQVGPGGSEGSYMNLTGEQVYLKGKVSQMVGSS